MTVGQTRQLALMDIVGTSSAFYAEILENLFAAWRDDTDKLLDALTGELDAIVEWAEGALPGEHKALAMAFLKHPMLQQVKSHSTAHHWATSELKKWLDEVRDLTPEYLYWPVANAAPLPDLKTTAFADGGDLENTGVASLLSYDDVDKVIAVRQLERADGRLLARRLRRQRGGDPGTRVLLDGQMPVLFGYQPWKEGAGYRLYAGAANPGGPEFQHNQVFTPEAFAELLRGFWTATGNTADPAEMGLQGKDTRAGVNPKPAILRQDLEVVANPWFGVKGGKTVEGRLELHQSGQGLLRRLDAGGAAPDRQFRRPHLVQPLAALQHLRNPPDRHPDQPALRPHRLVRGQSGQPPDLPGPFQRGVSAPFPAGPLTTVRGGPPWPPCPRSAASTGGVPARSIMAGHGALPASDRRASPSCRRIARSSCT